MSYFTPVSSCSRYFTFFFISQDCWNKETGECGNKGDEVEPHWDDQESKHLVYHIAEFVIPVPIAPEVNENMLGDVRVDVVLWVFSVILDKVISIDFLYNLTFNSVSFDDESCIAWSSGLHNQEVFVDIPIRDDFLVFTVKKCTIKEIIEVCNNCKSQEIHDDIHVRSVCDERYIIDRFNN